MIKILIADDDKSLRGVLLSELSGDGMSSEAADSGRKAVELMKTGDYDVVLLDLNMPDMGGIEALKEIRTGETPPEVIILTGNATVASAVEAMKLGAYDYLTKPFKLEELKAVIGKAYEKKNILKENLLLKTQIKRQLAFERIITKSPLMTEALETVRKVAPSDIAVLIYGESGTGKELVALAVHNASLRADKPFIAVNCGAIPETMLESELFGHEKGAFTGAYERKLGLLEVADGGTLLLDEIGEMSARLQTKLLRVIETGSFFRVGGVREIKVNVRFVSATNKDIARELEKGGFRADLYYRISALSLHIPPLRERKEDIPLLIEHSVNINPLFKNKRFAKEALSVMSCYAWPGNVRELQNMVHRALLLSKGDVIGPDDLPSDIASSCGAHPAKRLDDVEKEHILKVLKEAGGHRGRAAEVLGIDPKTLYRKLSGYGVED